MVLAVLFFFLHDDIEIVQFRNVNEN